MERLWTVGRHFHKDGSEELQAWVQELKGLLYAGKAKALVRRLGQLREATPRNGPGTKSRRQALARAIGYFSRRLDMMQYGVWRQQDLVIGSGQAEGAVRHLVGERFDCAGMRWVKEKAEALLHLRCIELNGDWEKFTGWFQRKNHHDLKGGNRRRVLTDKPLTLNRAA